MKKRKGKLPKTDKRKGVKREYKRTWPEVFKGDKFGYWLVLSDFISIDDRSNKFCWCRCVCGLEKAVRLTDITRNKTKACETCCRVSDPIRFLNLTVKLGLPRKLTNLRAYKIWRGMKERCHNQKSRAYINYGERGIRVCEEWQDFITFLEWSYSNGYCDSKTIERNDVMLGYSPQNCSWVDSAKQARNKTKYKNNKTGTCGVCLIKKSYVSYWYNEEGKLKTKSFSLKKYGEQKARELAITSRNEGMACLEAAGIFYGVSHGMEK
jgi:hypothetical protein